jgi:NAD(P)-dependent dehydrogenase (short-subunit alcohol dehydrogenase family)
MQPFPAAPVVISGAAGGLGAATARALAASGVPLLLLDRNAPDELAASLEREGAECLALGVELRDERSIAGALARGEQAFGPAGHLVHCAAVLRMAPIRELAAAEFRDVLDVNVVGAFLLARAVAIAASASGGAVVLVSSTGGIVSGADSVAYGASKHALHGVMQGLARAFGPSQVRVNAICPGTMDTPLFGREVARDWSERFDGASAEQKLEQDRRASLLGELPAADDVARLCVFLLSRASRAITGQIYTAWGAPVALA